MRCNAVFEGGGAKGIAHIGALKAIEDYGLTINKVAGTSAGAIISTLIALGYKADDLYNPETGEGKLPHNLLKIVFPRKRRCVALAVKAVLLLLLAYLTVLSFIPWRFFAAIAITFAVSLTLLNLSKKLNRLPRLKVCFRAVLSSVTVTSAGILLTPTIIPFTFLFWGFGLINTNGIEAWLEDMIKNSPAIKRAGMTNVRDVTFSKLYSMTKFDLKLISSDIGTREITVFSHENAMTKDLPIIDGIIASICIPLVFKCKKITINEQVYQFVDGGMLSNFPAWSYRKHTLLDDLKHTIGIKLSPSVKVRRDVDNSISYFKNLAVTALWGASSIENISVKGLNLVRIDTGKIGTLSFGMDADKVKSLYTSAYDQTRTTLINNYSLFPEGDAESWLEDISLSFVKAYEYFLTKVATNELSKEKLGTLEDRRACLIATIDQHLDISKIIYNFNMNSDLDRHLEFDKLEGAAGICLEEGLPLIYLPEHRFIKIPSERHLNASKRKAIEMCSNRKALVKDGLKVIVTLPIFSINELLDNGVIERDDETGEVPSLHNINFEETRNRGIKARAVLAIDFNDYFLYDKENKELTQIFESDWNEYVLSMFSYIASKAISRLSAQVSVEEEELA
ncbi:patatin-like phospholipase family protein [Vibrio mediterranei]|uniref:patatin-like phospholipase family protein n=1 Tax=Vibrio mediterranei TaxID=689 RepID=UPI00406774B5